MPADWLNVQALLWKHAQTPWHCTIFSFSMVSLCGQHCVEVSYMRKLFNNITIQCTKGTEPPLTLTVDKRLQWEIHLVYLQQRQINRYPLQSIHNRLCATSVFHNATKSAHLENPFPTTQLLIEAGHSTSVLIPSYFMSNLCIHFFAQTTRHPMKPANQILSQW